MCLFLLSSLVLLPIVSCSPQGGGLPMPSPIESMRCNRSEVCSAKFPGSDCRSGSFCQCGKEYVLDFDRCLPLIFDFSGECALNAQCALGTLGELSRCSERTRRCECWDTVGNGRRGVSYWAHTCYLSRALGEGCDYDEQCKGSIRPSASVRCSNRICTCTDGDRCENVKGGSDKNNFHAALLSLLASFAFLFHTQPPSF